MHVFRSYFLPTLLLPIIVLLATGCGDQLPTNPSDGRFIMPLAVGNRWVGLETTYASDGSVAGTRFDTIEIVDVITSQGATWYKSSPLKEGRVVWYQNNKEGLHIVSKVVGEIPDCNCLHLHYPAKQGESYELPSAQILLPDPNGGPPTTVEQKIDIYLQSTETKVQVPNGEHTCYLYMQRLLAPENARFVGSPPWQYYTPDLGPVKMEWYPQGDPAEGPMVKKWELVDVRLN